MVGGPLPFKRVIALEFGDGRPISGITKCHTHNTCYRFHQLTYHPFDPIAVYGLTTINQNHFTNLQTVYSKITKPHWPIWVPPNLDTIKPAQLATITSIEDAIWSNPKIDIIIAIASIVNTPLRAVATPNGTPDWFKLLGL